MAKIVYREVKLRPQSLAIVARCEAIVTAYAAQRLRLTLRQLFYQLVTQNVIPNSEKEYKRLSGIVSDARLSGLLDWDAIEDRVRVPRQCSEWPNIRALVAGAIYGYRLPRWEGQDFYVELWVEKDALAGVLAPLASEYHVTMMVNRGYSSQSAMYESAQRFIQDDEQTQSSKDPVLLYLGDFDPSGEDMVRDIGERLEMFGVGGLEVRKLALTETQIQLYRPPPNPAKLTDPRSAKFIAEHGASSWEVDALPPDVLQEIIRDALDGLVDAGKMNAVKEREERDKRALTKAAGNIR
jgi:hypothetical protein